MFFKNPVSLMGRVGSTTAILIALPKHCTLCPTSLSSGVFGDVLQEPRQPHELGGLHHCHPGHISVQRGVRQVRRGAEGSKGKEELIDDIVYASRGSGVVGMGREGRQGWQGGGCCIWKVGATVLIRTLGLYDMLIMRRACAKGNGGPPRRRL